MSLYSKVAVAVDRDDYDFIRNEVDNIWNQALCASMETPDNTYIVTYWEWVEWYGKAVDDLNDKLSSIRHATILISEDGRVETDIAESDDRGIDEEFSEILSWTADICFWHDGEPLAPRDEYIPMTRKRMKRLLESCLEQLAEGADPDTLYMMLVDAGFTDEEIDTFGFGYCIPEEKEDEDDDVPAFRLRILEDM